MYNKKTLKKHENRSDLRPVQRKSRFRFDLLNAVDNSSFAFGKMVGPWQGQDVEPVATFQDGALTGLKDWYPQYDSENLQFVHAYELNDSLERTKMYGPYDNDTVRWLLWAEKKGLRVKFGRTYDGKEYVEF